eukprot:scaffold720_cov114-Cylindrotheca_fusiformis.AAC.7
MNYGHSRTFIRKACSILEMKLFSSFQPKSWTGQSSQHIGKQYFELGTSLHLYISSPSHPPHLQNLSLAILTRLSHSSQWLGRNN